MRITRIATQALSLPLDPPFRAAWDPSPRTRFEATLVRVETDEGITGIGSGDTLAGLAGHEHLFIGRDPLALARHGRTLETLAFHAGRCWPLEAALWDIAGQALGVPVATLLGGACERLPAYASLGEMRPPAARAEDARALLEEGFRAVKVRIARDRIPEGIGVVRAMRETVGDALEIMVDLNQGWRMPGDIEPALGPQAARAVIEELAELDVLWVEEPLPAGDLAGMRQLREQTGRRVAGGEMATSFGELRRALDADALDVFQPDSVLALGIGGARTLAELALRANRWFTPHTWTNGIGLLTNLHVVCGVGGGPFVEFPYDPPAWTPERRDFMLAEPVGIDGDGMLAVPRRPGLGIELDEAALAAYAVDDAPAVAG
ncbi:MAG TPA: mandelate racemase/muconate lactonizing enzyme family protein [Solirubrobacteraceae bacterium]|nr:mandelate racemase/muconate lactonizing enzyme family protein [Solirubrobacteraceae bacterium]